jgi:HPt (histidine-containing phosphotransfer) domain-containing protein
MQQVASMAVPPQPGLTPNSETGTPAPAGDVEGQAMVVLDAQALAGLSALDPTGTNRLVQRVLATYQGSLGRLLAQLGDALARSDPAGMRLAAHTLKSSSASIGALELARLCAATEAALREGRAETVPGLVDALMREASGVEAAVRARLAN